MILIVWMEVLLCANEWVMLMGEKIQSCCYFAIYDKWCAYYAFSKVGFGSDGSIYNLNRLDECSAMCRGVG